MKPLREWSESDAQTYLSDKTNLSSINRITKAGEGNMNCTMRVSSKEGSLILKQSSPYCEKFPSIAAPIERITFEKDFYEEASKNLKLQSYFPKVEFYDEDNYILAMTDLGESSDLSYLYTSDELLEAGGIKWMAEVLSLTHQTKFSSIDKFKNEKMRELNHAHIFQIPFEKENGLNLEEISKGLTELKNKYVTDEVKKVAIELGETYLNSNEGYLLHGDFYLGSIITTEKGKFLIDPEFCFIGEKEFDIGVMFAHLYLSGHQLEQTELFLNSYLGDFDKAKVNKYAGIEIMRRLLGYAQLPISKDLANLGYLLSLAEQLIKK